MSWIALVVLVLLAWLAFKAIGFMVRIALWVAMAAVAYWLFAQLFGWPVPFGTG